MIAAMYTRYGPPNVVRVVEADKPIPADGEVLIRIRAASVNPLDWHLIRGSPRVARLFMGLVRPKLTRPGADVAGHVESVGKDVNGFASGDAVFGGCRGACAEYVCTPATALEKKPDNLTFDEAAALPVAGITALQGLRDNGHLSAGQKVLINGASGGVGTFAVQIAKAFGAEVTGVCSTRNVQMVRSIGACRVIDYTREDFTQSELRFDVLLDCAGNRPLRACRRLLNPGGRYVLVGAPEPFRRIARMRLLSLFGGPRLVFFLARQKPGDLRFLAELAAAGKLRPVIDRRFTLSEVAEAIRYNEAGHARGKVIVTIDDRGR